MPESVVHRYKDKDISGQALLDASIILLNDELIDMKLQPRKFISHNHKFNQTQLKTKPYHQKDQMKTNSTTNDKGLILLEIINDIASHWESIVIPIFGKSKHPSGATTIGSGFIATINNHFLLITAAHVAKTIQESNIITINIKGCAVNLTGLPIIKNALQDIALIPLSPKWMEQNKLKTIKSVAINAPNTDWKRTGIYIAMGYPSSRNMLDSRYKKFNRYCHSISLAEINSCDLNTSIQNPLLLQYDHENIFNNKGEKLGAQIDLHGMSGGPCMEILKWKNLDGTIKYTLDPTAVLAEWHKNKKIIIASKIKDFFIFPKN